MIRRPVEVLLALAVAMLVQAVLVRPAGPDLQVPLNEARAEVALPAPEWYAVIRGPGEAATLSKPGEAIFSLEDPTLSLTVWEVDATSLVVQEAASGQTYTLSPGQPLPGIPGLHFVQAVALDHLTYRYQFVDRVPRPGPQLVALQGTRAVLEVEVSRGLPVPTSLPPLTEEAWVTEWESQTDAVNAAEVRALEGSPQIPATPDRVCRRPLTEPFPGQEYLKAGYLRTAWQVAGRAWLRSFAGVRWNDFVAAWEPDPEWPYGPSDVSARAYFIEYATRGAVNLALVGPDVGLMEELAGFHLVYLARFAAPESRSHACALCDSQFFHPAARLLRGIAMLPEAQRTPPMGQFVASYLPLLLREHLLRLRLSTQRRMPDQDLWLIATAAEVLGAHAGDPALVPLRPDEGERLRALVQFGVQRFQQKRTLYRDTRDFQGRVVETASYFNGDFDDRPDMAYAWYTGEAFPTPADKQPPHGGSWDISHFYRVPVFLRSLYDNRQATGVAFPQPRDLERVINQYVYKVFQGDFRRPHFRNFFDGHDGWYRVGYHGPDFGYPPSRYCDRGDPKRPCLIGGGIYGWGQLACFHPELTRLQEALVRLAESSEPELVAFRDRYYRVGREGFAFTDPAGNLQYPFQLFVVLADNAEQIFSQ